MNIRIFDSKIDMGSAAAEQAAAGINAAIQARGAANLILATGASQFEMMAALVKMPVDWSAVTAFHLDEYVGMSDSHPASFRKYLRERFVEQAPGLHCFNYVAADGPDPAAECARVGALISENPIDVACVGIGENGHLAFNDPPADFETEAPYIVVDLDEDCRRQQLGEGWFPTLEDVPTQAISMGIRQIMKSRCIVCTVPDERKADAVRRTVQDDIGPDIPASILRTHVDCTLYLDAAAAGQLGQ